LPPTRSLARVQLEPQLAADARGVRPIARRGTQLAAAAGMLQLLACLALLFSLADHWTTYLCLRASVAGWEVSEANPLADWLFQQFGLGTGLWIDTLVTAVVLVVLVRTQRVARPAKLAALAVLIATTAYAVANNLRAVQMLGLSLAGPLT
jgi:hypothetical protein